MLIHPCTTVLFSFLDVITSYYPVYMPYVTKIFHDIFLKAFKDRGNISHPPPLFFSILNSYDWMQTGN